MKELLFLISCVAVVAAGDSEEVVEVVLGGGGVVKGAQRTSKGGKGYFAFSAIPFAEPPVDRKRFMPPVPLPPLEGVLDATQDGPPCAQAALGITEGEEDCLHLYVYTPEVPIAGGSNVRLPVVVWLHGGAFVVGGAATLDESLLMDRPLVLVVPQYRLGLLGFFHTPTGTATGNMGMMDQVAALQWVQDNIGAFGGDPGQVTLAGDCGGGAAAIYHMLSPLSSGLFHRVLSLSGSPLSPWALYTNNHRFMLILANYVKCPAHDQRLTVKCFQELDLWELLDPVQMLCESRDLMVGNHRLAPAVQKLENSHASTLFLDAHPLRLLRQAPINAVPVVMGVTKNVGTYLVDMLLYDFMTDQLEKDPDFLESMLEMMVRESRIPEAASHKEEFQDFYFPGEDFKNFTAILPGLAKMLGDIHYHAGILSAASYMSEHVDTRVMRFEFDGGPSLFNQRHPNPQAAPALPTTAGHGDEVALILPEERRALTPEQERASARLLDMVENFAYGRPPREDWPKFKQDKLTSLVFTADGEFATQPFSAPDRTEMLERINSWLHQKVLKEMKEEEEEEKDGSRRKDEL